LKVPLDLTTLSYSYVYTLSLQGASVEYVFHQGISLPPRILFSTATTKFPFHHLLCTNTPPTR